MVSSGLARAVERLTAPLRRRVALMVGRAVLTAVDDSPRMQMVQLAALAGETLDGRERMQEYGFTSHPHPGCEAIIVAVGGDRNHPLVIATDDRRHRLAGLGAGDVAVYSSGGNRIVLRGNGDIEADAPGHCTVTAGGDAVVSAGGNATITAGGLARLAGNVVELHATTRFSFDCHGHGLVWWPDRVDAWTIGQQPGASYPISPPEIEP